jgi:hypothetical protein
LIKKIDQLCLLGLINRITAKTKIKKNNPPHDDKGDN